MPRSWPSLKGPETHQGRWTSGQTSAGRRPGRGCGLPARDGEHVESKVERNDRRTAKVGLEAVGIDDGDVGLDGEQGRARFRDVLGDVSSPPREDLVDGRDAVLRRLDLDEVDGLGA